MDAAELIAKAPAPLAIKSPYDLDEEHALDLAKLFVTKSYSIATTARIAGFEASVIRNWTDAHPEYVARAEELVTGESDRTYLRLAEDISLKAARQTRKQLKEASAAEAAKISATMRNEVRLERGIPTMNIQMSYAEMHEELMKEIEVEAEVVEETTEADQEPK